MSPQIASDVRIDDEVHKQLLADAMLTLATDESDDVNVPTAVDLELETAPVAWYIVYKQNIREEDIPQA